jgi:hypothetical protein
MGLRSQQHGRAARTAPGRGPNAPCVAARSGPTRELEREAAVTVAELSDEIVEAMIDVYRPHGMTSVLAEALIAASENAGSVAAVMEEPTSWARDLDILDRIGVILASHLKELGVPLADSLVLDQELRHRVGAPLLTPDGGPQAGHRRRGDRAHRRRGARRPGGRGQVEHGARDRPRARHAATRRAAPPPTRR